VTKDLICPEIIEGEVIVNGTGGASPYSYSNDSGKTFEFKNRWTQLDSGNYYYQIRDNEGCRTFVNAKIKSAPIFRFNASPKSTTIKLGETVQLGYDVLEGDKSWVNQVFWKESTGLSCTDCEQPIASTFVDNQYVLTLKYLNKCIRQDTVFIKVIDDNELYIPSAFSPASLQIENQSFKIYSNNILSARVSIFNRWGEKIFETDEGHLVGWDGIYNGNSAMAGTYSYIVEVVYLNRRKVIKKGEVTLIR
jgi:gliding motility-associated-like protein